jgi:Fe-S cluster assembly iron-binding protein IscA
MTAGAQPPVKVPATLVDLVPTWMDGWWTENLSTRRRSSVITITPRALSVVRRVTDHPRLNPGSGLRISTQPGPDAALEVRIARQPEPEDRIVERDGGRLYVGPSAVDRVDGRELDAVTDADGRVHFVTRRAA